MSNKRARKGINANKNEVQQLSARTLEATFPPNVALGGDAPFGVY